jgi:hypothetical protein
MNLIRDLAYGLRQLSRRPFFSLAIVLTLAIGIGPNVAIFSVLKALVLEPLPYPEPNRLVHVWETDVDGRWKQPFTYPDFHDVREQNESFEAFGVWGIPPAHGRLFSEGEVEDGARVAVIADSLWRRVFGGDPAIVGESVPIDSVSYQVVGVMPPDFEYFTPWTAGPILSIIDSTGRMARDVAISSMRPSARSRRFSASSRLPRRIASTATSTLPQAVITITGSSPSLARICSTSGLDRSMMTESGSTQAPGWSRMSSMRPRVRAGTQRISTGTGVPWPRRGMEQGKCHARCAIPGQSDRLACSLAGSGCSKTNRSNRCGRPATRRAGRSTRRDDSAFSRNCGAWYVS